MQNPAQPETQIVLQSRPLARLRLLHTTDIHATLLGYDYFADKPNATYGLARAASLIDQLRQHHPNCLMLDGGDFLQGTPLADWSAQQDCDHQANPVIAAFNSIGYDAVALGNHDFGFGLEHLKSAIAQANFPVLCANVFETAAAGKTVTQPSTILTRFLHGPDQQPRPIKIGLFGVLPPQVVSWEKTRLGGAVTSCLIAESAKTIARDLRKEGADLIIALCHSGISEAGDQSENASVVVAEIDEVDVVFSGHTHQVFPGNDHPASPRVDPDAGTLCGKPAVMAGRYGSHIGLIDLHLRQTAGGWQIEHHESSAIPVKKADTETPESPAIVAILKAVHQETLSYIRQPVGSVKEPLNSFFSAVQNDRALRLVAEAQRRFVQNAIKDSRFSDLPVLSAAAPLKSGDRSGTEHFTQVPAGEINIAAISDLYYFSNDIAALQLTGKQVHDWLEMAAGRYRQIKQQHHGQPLLDAEFASYNADVIHGLTYEIDLSQPARYSVDGRLRNPHASRIRNLCHNGRPLDPDQAFVIATNSYRASGGGHFPGISASESLTLEMRDMRSVLADHIRTQPNIFGTNPAAWKFTPMPDTSAHFETSPMTAKLLHMASEVKLTAVGLQPSGFLTLRIDF